jgi:hypothetical protein
MPTRKYSLKPGEPPRLVIRWTQRGRWWKDLTVRLDGAEVGTLATGKELQAGATFPLPDGSQLQVRQIQSLLGVELQVLQDGRPVPGSATDPAVQVRRAAQCVFAIAGMSIVMGLLAEGLHWQALQARGVGYVSVVYGLIFLPLGCFVWRGSFPALLTAVILHSLDGLAALAASPVTGRPPSGLILRIFFLFVMIRGLGAIRTLNQEKGRREAFADA